MWCNACTFQFLDALGFVNPMYHFDVLWHTDEVVTEAVGLKDKTIDLKQIQILGLSDKIGKKRLAWLEDEFRCLISRCLVLRKEVDQTLRRIEDIKVEQQRLEVENVMD
ncbi:hypothetical protein L1987_35371 [Smallanthus sonchifolius]|uniref:Uncharacterized protein n=1 Tax=Smallanthus sonchifolius TaxID=185202 RepID=A0ACB9HVQ0_9ASTR|nr:hypothetical protein L1987_35371 [Smallanthus sonchifolius]